MQPMQRRTFLQLATLSASALFSGAHWLTASAAAPTPFPVYLTFEGGPISKSDLSGATTDLLDILKKYKAVATFFASGRDLHSWDGALLSRILSEGHAIGNRLWQAQGNTSADQSAPSLLAEQYLKTEKKLRALIQQTSQDAATAYDAQVKLYRRPGGDNALAAFLDPANYEGLTHEPFLKNYVENIGWLKAVYDYSGWHVSAGVEPAKVNGKARSTPYALTRRIVTGSKSAQGAAMFLCVSTNKKRASEAARGLVIQLFENDKLTVGALPQMLLQLRAKGAEFHVLARPDDKMNTLTIGVEDPPTADNNGVACGA